MRLSWIKGSPHREAPEGTKNIHEHERAFICAACSDPALAHRLAGDGAAVARPLMGKRAQVA